MTVAIELVVSSIEPLNRHSHAWTAAPQFSSYTFRSQRPKRSFLLFNCSMKSTKETS